MAPTSRIRPGAPGRTRGDLISFRCESGVEVLDLPDAPRPDPATPAPVRLIAEFQPHASHADRTRVISDANSRRAFSRNGIVPGVVLVDGSVAAIWRLRLARTAAVLRIEELRPLTGEQRGEVEAEGRRMLTFAVPGSAHDVEFGPAT